MTSEMNTIFNFIEMTAHPLSLTQENCYNYKSIIDNFLNYEIDYLNNYILYTKNKEHYPKVDSLMIDILDHINNSKLNSNDNYKYKLFCTLFWLHIHKYDQINELVNDFKEKLKIKQ